MASNIPNPLVTVLMSVYNGGRFLRESVDSILSQTYKQFEFIIVDDASNDDTPDILKAYQTQDDRIRVIRNNVNLGVSTSKNIGLRNAAGKYITIMDCDDISVPNRLEKQVAFMETRPFVGASGCWLNIIGTDGKHLSPYPVNPDYIKCLLLFCSAIPHPAAIIRNAALQTVKYNTNYPYAHDYNLWIQLADATQLSNLPQVLLHYRRHPYQISTQYNTAQWEETCSIQKNLLQKLGIPFTSNEFEIHKAVSFGRFIGNYDHIKSLDFLRSVAAWFNKLQKFNQTSNYYQQEMFSLLLTQFHEQLRQILQNKFNKPLQR